MTSKNGAGQQGVRMPCQTLGTWEGAMYHQETLEQESSREAERRTSGEKKSVRAFLSAGLEQK